MPDDGLGPGDEGVGGRPAGTAPAVGGGGRRCSPWSERTEALVRGTSVARGVSLVRRTDAPGTSFHLSADESPTARLDTVSRWLASSQHGGAAFPTWVRTSWWVSWSSWAGRPP